MAQIKGVMNQAHRNNELEQIKQMYHSDSTTLLNGAGNENELGNETEQINYEESELDSDEEEEDQIIIESTNNNEVSQSFDQILSLWKSMLENECLDDNLEGDENGLAANSFLNNVNLENFTSSKKHPQRNPEAKWKLADLFTEELGPPSYIDTL